MAQQWHPFQTMFRPALPPPRLTADVYETAGGEAWVLEIPVPGLSAEDITIDANADSVTVAIRRQPDEEGSARRYLLREQPERPASRVFQFPVEIDTDEIRATLQAGILRIHVPKAAASRPRVIKVNQAA